MRPQKHFCTHWHGFVSKEINGLIAVIFHVAQAVPLVPSMRKDIDADLASCQGRGHTGRGEREASNLSPGPAACTPSGVGSGGSFHLMCFSNVIPPKT